MRCINYFYFLFLFSNNIKCSDAETIKLDNNVTIYVYDDNTCNTYWTKTGFECNKKIIPSDFYNLKDFTPSNSTKLKIDELDESYKIYKIQIVKDGYFVDYEKGEFDKIEKYWITFIKTYKLSSGSSIKIDNVDLDLNNCYFYFDSCENNEEDFLKCIYRFNKDKINIENFVNDYGIYKYYSHKENKIETCYSVCFSDTISELLQSIKEGKKLVLEIVKKINYSVSDIKLSKDLEKVYKFISTDEKNKIIENINNQKVKGFREKYSKKDLLRRSKDLIDDVEDYEDKNDSTSLERDSKFDFVITKFKKNSPVFVPKQCTIKFEAGNNLFITSEEYKTININFSEGGITTDTNIENYINTTYDKIKNNCIITPQGDNSGKFEDGTIVTVTINAEIDGITSQKDPNKVYVKVQIKVSDDSKFRFKGKLATSDNFDLEFEKDKKITDLLNKIITKLDNNALKDGYKIELNNAVVDNGTTLVPDANYVIILADDDPNFVEEIKQEPIDNPGDTDKAKKDALINECKNLLSDIKNLDSSYNEPINNDATIDNLNKLKDKLTSKLKALKNKKPENNNNNNTTNNDNTDSTTIKEEKGYSGKKKAENTNKKKCCKS